MQANTDKSAQLLYTGEIPLPLLNNAYISKVKQTKVHGVWVDDNLKCSYQLHLAKKTLKDKWSMLEPYLANKLKAFVARKILQTVILSKATYLSHIWDISA